MVKGTPEQQFDFLFGCLGFFNSIVVSLLVQSFTSEDGKKLIKELSDMSPPDLEGAALIGWDFARNELVETLRNYPHET